MVRQVAESAMREVVGRNPAQDVFRDARDPIKEEVREITQAILNTYKAGLNINAVEIEDVAPPREVADAFDEVQRAEQNEDQFIEEGNQYANRILGEARGEAAQIREDAAAYKNRVVEEAKGEAQRFVSVYEEYKKAPEVTRKRLFLETMEKVLRDSNKVIVEQGNGQGVVPYLPLPEINKRNNAQEHSNMGNKAPLILVIVAFIGYLVYNSLFVVNERDQGIVLRFGEIQKVETEPGLYFKLPFTFLGLDTVQIIEDRLLRLDLDDLRVQVSGGKFYEVDAFFDLSVDDGRRFRSQVSGNLITC